MSRGDLEGRWCSGTRESSEGLAGSLDSCECSYGDGAPRRERAAMLAAVQGPPAILGRGDELMSWALEVSRSRFYSEAGACG